MRKLSVLLLVLALLFSFAGCGAPAKSTSGNAAVSDMAYRNEEKPAASEASDSTLPNNRKLIQTVRMTVEVYDFDSVYASIEERISQHGGYIESTNIYNGNYHNGTPYRNADMTIRIPADNLNVFLSTVSDVTHVVSSTKTVEDVTLQYVSTESRLTALKTEEARLLELLAKAETMDDLLAIESRLTDVRTELERVASTLKVYDNQVDYATVHLDINQVKDYTPTEEPSSIWERMGSGFVESLKNLWNGLVELFAWFVISLPYLAVLGAAAVLVIILVRKHNKKKSNK